MSYAWSLPIALPIGRGCCSLPLLPERLRAVIPTYHDWEGARETVESILACRPRPAEIVLVNDNDEAGYPLWVSSLPIHIVNYSGNRGPAHARNAGASFRTGHRFEWIYFTDTGCQRGRDFFAMLAGSHAMMDSAVVAVAGPVCGASTANSQGPINRYMTEEAILAPPFDLHGPQALVTANAAVCARAFRMVRGFDESFPTAGGEDLDLGLRLRRLGRIGWAPAAVVSHPFPEDQSEFRRRFIRYGEGTARLERKHRLHGLRPSRFTAHDGALQHLADLQIAAMTVGYDRHEWAALCATLPGARHRGTHRPEAEGGCWSPRTPANRACSGTVDAVDLIGLERPGGPSGRSAGLRLASTRRIGSSCG